MKSRPVGAELFHADRRTDRQTDMTELIYEENQKKVSNDCTNVAKKQGNIKLCAVSSVGRRVSSIQSSCSLSIHELSI